MVRNGVGSIIYPNKKNPHRSKVGKSEQLDFPVRAVPSNLDGVPASLPLQWIFEVAKIGVFRRRFNLKVNLAILPTGFWQEHELKSSR